MISDSLVISNGDLVAAINPIGSELGRLTFREDYDLLWNGDPAIWSGQAPILFPVVGMLVDGRYRLDESTYDMPKHGFARTSTFETIEHRHDTIVLRLDANPATRAIYPFDFRLNLTFEVAADTLSMRADISNRGNRTMPMSYGFHPAFRWPLPFGEARGDHRITFDAAEFAPIRRMNAQGLLLPDVCPSPVEGRTLSLCDSLFADDALIFDALRSRRLTYGAPGAPSLDIASEHLPDLGLWTKPGANFIAIEPWQGYNDAIGFSGDFRDKPGVIQIAPGGARSFSMTVAVKDHDND